MSILDALRVQKMNQQSVAELSALPQNEIIRLAQMGHIPADVVPVVINEKARMAQEMANMRAAAQMQGGVPTVIEQAMMANAQAEQPQAMPPQMPQQPPQQMPQEQAPAEAGVGALPTGEMFQGQSFQSGGIVAFSGEDESFVQDQGGLYVAKEEMPSSKPVSLIDYINQYKAATAGARAETPEEKAYAAARAKGSMSAQDKDQQKWMRLLEAGLGIMGGKSPYAMQNIAEGSKSALQGYGEDLKAQRAAQMADLKEAADLARTKRQEELKDIEGGAKLYEAELENQRRLAIARDSQLGVKYADNYVAMRVQAGDKRPVEEIKAEGFDRFMYLYNQAGPRAVMAAGTAAGAQDVQLTGIDRALVTQAQQSVDDMLKKIATPEAREYRKRQKESAEAAAKYRQELIDARVAELNAAMRATSVGPRGTAAPGAPAPAAPGAPAAAAPGAPAPATRTPSAMPRTQAELQDGVVYQTSRGPARWDASQKQFFPVQ